MAKAERKLKPEYGEGRVRIYAPHMSAYVDAAVVYKAEEGAVEASRVWFKADAPASCYEPAEPEVFEFDGRKFVKAGERRQVQNGEHALYEHGAVFRWRSIYCSTQQQYRILRELKPTLTERADKFAAEVRATGRQLDDADDLVEFARSLGFKDEAPCANSGSSSGPSSDS